MSFTTTDYGSWNNHADEYELTVESSVGTSLGDYAHEYDVDAIVADYRDAINKALPDRVTLTGNEFIGPAYEKDCTWEGDLDIHAVIESVDFWEIAERHEQWDIDQVAEHLGHKGPSAAGSARKTLSRLGVKATAYRPHPESGRPQARYNAQEVQEAQKGRPGQGARTDKASA